MEADAQWFVALCLEKKVIQPAQWMRLQSVLGANCDILQIAETIVTEKICNDDILLQELIYCATDRAKAGSKPPPVPGMAGKRRSLTQMLADMAESAKGRTVATDKKDASGEETEATPADPTGNASGRPDGPDEISSKAPPAEDPQSAPPPPAAPTPPPEEASPAETEEEDDDDPAATVARLGRMLNRQAWTDAAQAASWLADLTDHAREHRIPELILQSDKPVLIRAAEGGWQPLHPESFKEASLEDLFLGLLPEADQQDLETIGTLTLALDLGQANAARAFLQVGPEGLTVQLAPYPVVSPALKAYPVQAAALKRTATLTVLMGKPGVAVDLALDAILQAWLESEGTLVAAPPLTLPLQTTVDRHDRLVRLDPLSGTQPVRWLNTVLNLNPDHLVVTGASPEGMIPIAWQAAAAGLQVLLVLPTPRPGALPALLTEAGMDWKAWLKTDEPALTGLLVAPESGASPGDWRWLPVEDDNRDALIEQGPG
ncbi:MAG: hypothetical protein ACFE0O_00755 [Opitutales bacterium]